MLAAIDAFDDHITEMVGNQGLPQLPQHAAAMPPSLPLSNPQSGTHGAVSKQLSGAKEKLTERTRMKSKHSV